MKSLAILLVLVLRITNVFADDNAAISKVFIHKSGKNNLYVLQLKDGNAYDYMRYTDKRMYHDYGIFSIRHGKITFVSKNRQHGFNSVGGKTYFMNKKGLFKSRTDALFGKKSALDVSADPAYMKSWDYNPITGKNDADIAAEKAKVAEEKNTKANEAHLKQMAAFTKTFYVNTTFDYANPYETMLEQNYCGPESCITTVGDKVVPYTGDTSKSLLLSNYGTVMHESTHTFNNSGKYLVIPGIEIPVSKTETFHSEEFKNLVPADASGKIFRYNTYVGEGAVVSSNVNGIYGLMDEFSAYENGTRSCVLAAKSALAKGDTALAKNFISQANSTYFAQYEFELFMAWYLHDAKTNHADIYKSTMANNNLRLTYTLIDQEFTSTIADMKAVAKAAGMSKDFMNYNDTMYAAYPKQLLVNEKSYLDAFKLKGVTEKNYSSFVKALGAGEGKG